ncbi:hypothetical protein [Corynebacterium propinquum]
MYLVLGGLPHVDAVLADTMRQIAMPHEPCGHVAQSPQQLG